MINVGLSGKFIKQFALFIFGNTYASIAKTISNITIISNFFSYSHRTTIVVKFNGVFE